MRVIMMRKRRGRRRRGGLRYEGKRVIECDPLPGTPPAQTLSSVWLIGGSGPSSIPNGGIVGSGASLRGRRRRSGLVQDARSHEGGDTLTEGRGGVGRLRRKS